MLLVDTYAGWKGSLPEEEVRVRVEGVRQMLATADHLFDPTLPGLFAGNRRPSSQRFWKRWPQTFAPKHEDCAACDGRGRSARSDAAHRCATLLIWGERDARSPLSVARQFEDAVPDAKLVVIAGAGHASNLEAPQLFNDAVREFCRAHPLHTA